MTDQELRPMRYREAARLGRVSEETIGRLVKRGVLRRVPEVKGLLTRRSVEAWLAGDYGAADGEAVRSRANDGA